MSDEGALRPSRRRLLKFAGASTVAGLAGCNDVVPEEREFDATPAGLSVEGMGQLNHEAADYEQLTEEREVPGVDTTAVLTSHAVVYGTGGESDSEGPPEAPFPVTHDADRNIGMLSEPTVELAGRRNNPMATDPLGEIIAGERGRSLLRRLEVVETAEFDWAQRPRRVATRDVDAMGTTATVESHFGAVAGGEGPDTLVLIHATRVERDGDAIIVGGARARSASGGGNCVSGAGSEIEPEGGAYEFDPDPECLDLTLEDFETGLRETIPCPPSVAGKVGAYCEGEAPVRPWQEWPKIDVGNLRLVQKVEETEVVSGSHTEGSPDLVWPEMTAPVFEFQNLSYLSNSNLPNTVDVEVTVYKDDGSISGQYDFRISDSKLRDIKGGDSEIAKFHEMANDNDRQNDPPVFRLVGDDDAVEVEVAPNTGGIIGGTARIDVSPTSVGPLVVGFMEVRDSGGGPSRPNTSAGDNYGTTNGGVRDYTRTVNTAVEYLQRTYPGPVIAYRHDLGWFGGGITEDDNNDGKIDEEGDQSIKTDLRDVRKHLDKVANRSTFPQGYVYRSSYHTQGASASIAASNGFDATVAVVPNDDSTNPGAGSYFSHHGKSYPGVYWGHNRAVAMMGGSPTGQGRWISTLCAQEVGHYFQSTHYEGPSGHPMAQRDDGGSDRTLNNSNNTPVDLHHARHQNSDMLDRDVDGDGDDDNLPPDGPGVASIAYDLEDGDFNNVQQYTNPNGNFQVTRGPSSSATSIDKIESFMSYDGADGQLWTDARIHQDMIDSNWSWPNQGGSSSAGPVLSATGRITDDGAVEYDDVAAYEGLQRYVRHDDAPVEVSLVDPNGEVLERVRVPDRTVPSHGEPKEGFAEFLLPYPTETARVETSYRGTTTRMNPIVRSVRDELREVPPEGYVDSPEERRDAIDDDLDRVADLMAEEEYEEAAEAMADVRAQVAEGVRDGYSGAINDPDGEQLVVLVDDAVDRLRTLAGTV